MGRAPCCDKANVKKGPWSPEEDRKLKDYIDKHGTGSNWIALPHKAGLKRCGKSCRLRWLNYLRPNIKHGDFSDDEDRIICNLFASIGSRWSIIAAQLPGRTDNDIKNYWNTKLKKKILGFPPPTHRSSKSTQNLNHQNQTLESHSHPSHPFFSSPLDTSSLSNTISPFSSSSQNLNGFPMISSFLFNPNNNITTQIKGSFNGGNMLAFGGDQIQSSRSSDVSYVTGIDFDLSHITAGEQLGFESYLFGGNFEETQKLLLLHEAPPLMEVNNNGMSNNYEELKPLVGLNNGSCDVTYTASAKTPTSQDRFLF
ncbi:hypothetical protein LUZ60_012202 [Juncus effusus]|nr:hypothetical protein LUZ60_012202 [Juncus effusus]